MLKVESASVVLPVHNQADHIEAVLSEYVASLQRLGIPFELLPVINGPRRDASLEICRCLQERYGCIRTLCIEESGWGHAVRAGLASATGDLLCYTNSARTTGKDLLLLLQHGMAHPDCVIKAHRKIRESAGRRLGSLLYNLECRSLFDLPYWDINGTPKVFHRAMAKLLALSRNDDLIDLEFNAICRAQGYQVIELPIFSSSRRSGKSTTNWVSAFRMYRGAWQLRRLMSREGRP